MARKLFIAEVIPMYSFCDPISGIISNEVIA